MRIAVISLWQPWASLWLVRDQQGERVKLHETRGWGYPLGLQAQRIAVHASQTQQGYRSVSKELGEICDDVFGPHWGLELPRGGVIGMTTLWGCTHTQDTARTASADDLVCGDWSAGRFAWEGKDPVLYREAIPLKGRQRFFYWDAPDDLKVAA